MDENQYIESIFEAPPETVINRCKYTLFCKRPSKNIAELIRDDLVKQGKKSIVTKLDGEFVVWWA
jgi:hypothetical protein